MTIQRAFYNGPITFVCDECGDELETDETDFTDALDKFKDDGGVATKRAGGDWQHICIDCIPF